MVGKSSEAVDVYKKILANQYDDETKEEEETEESAEQTEERTEADASGAVSAEKPKKGLWRERLIANAQLVEYGDKAAEIVDFAIIDHKGMITSSVDKNQRFRIKMKIKFHETMEHPILPFRSKTGRERRLPERIRRWRITQKTWWKQERPSRYALTRSCRCRADSI